MLLRYYGHSQFTLALESGLTLLTDPYGAFRDYPRLRLQAQAVTVSHHHHDHDAIDWVAGQPKVFDQAGTYELAPNVSITGIPSYHDDANGTLRGENLLFRVQAEGLTLLHLGDLGHLLTERQVAAIGAVDVLLTPVGGFYTTDAETAMENARRLRARLTIPMHYRTTYSADMPIQTEEAFLQLAQADSTPMPLIRLTKGDLDERPRVICMAISDHQTV